MAINPSAALGAVNASASLGGLGNMNAAAMDGFNPAVNLDGAGPLNASAQTLSLPDASSVGSADGSSFESALSFIDQAAAKENQANQLATAFAQGKDVPLHDVMAASEEASIALETLAALRDKVTDAVNELTKMQI